MKKPLKKIEHRTAKERSRGRGKKQRTSEDEAVTEKDPGRLAEGQTGMTNATARAFQMRLRKEYREAEKKFRH